MADLLDPKNDYVFKRLFVDAPALLADLISAVRHDEPPVEHVRVLNPRIEPADLHGKYIVLDLLVADTAGRRYNVEMQVRHYRDYPERAAYYLANTLAGQLEGGEEYTALPGTVGIHLLDFTLYNLPQWHWCVELCDRTHPQVRLTDALQLHLLELPKAPDEGVVGTALAAWVAYFEHWQEDEIMARIQHAPVRDAMDRLQALSADEEAKRRAFERERAVHDEISFLNSARREGREEGRQEGQVGLLTRQLQRKFGPLPEVVVQRLQQADEASLDRWADQVLFADTLEAAFRD